MNRTPRGSYKELERVERECRAQGERMNRTTSCTIPERFL